MQIRVFVLPGGTLQIFVDEGSFAEAEVATQLILAKLQAAGIPFEQIGDIEQHREDVDHVHVRGQLHVDH